MTRARRKIPERELLVHTPAVFVRVAAKGLTGYGEWKNIRRMEGNEMGLQSRRNKGQVGEIRPPRLKAIEHKIR